MADCFELDIEIVLFDVVSICLNHRRQAAVKGTAGRVTKLAVEEAPLMSSGLVQSSQIGTRLSLDLALQYPLDAGVQRVEVMGIWRTHCYQPEISHVFGQGLLV